jgi:hypothetical protein
MIYWKNQSTLDWLIQCSVFWISLSRIPLFLLHKKSNHIFTVRQHIVLLVLRQYENKGYRMFVEWLLEAYYLKMFMQLSNTPHYTTLQKFAARVSGTILEKIISSFVVLLLSNIRRLFIGIIDSSGFKLSIQCFPILYRQSKLT